MTVAFITKDWAVDKRDNVHVPNGAGWYRCYLPMTVVPGAKMGKPRFNLTEGFGIDTPDGGVFGFDTVVLKLLMEKQTVRQIEKAKSLGQRVIVDVDDYFPGIHSANVAAHYASPEVSPNENRDWHEQVVMLADTVTVSTPFLRDYYAPLHPDVRMIRNGVDLDMFKPLHRQVGRTAIGWVGSLGWRSEDLETMRPWLPALVEKFGLRFHHGGHYDPFGFAYEKAGVRRERCSIQPMVPVHRVRSLMDFDIGLVPLNDIPFNHAKSCLKGLEYAASGIPFVAQALPEYRLLESEGVGKTAETPAEWTEAVAALIPAQARRRAAEAAYEALSGWTIEARAGEWVDAVTRTGPASPPRTGQ